MSSEKRKRRLIFSWTTTNGLLAILLYLTAALTFEYLVISAFLSYGLTDYTPLIDIFNVPLSLVFHLIPLSVVVALLSSWMYLTRCIAVIQPEKAIAPKKQGNIETLSYFWRRSHFTRAAVKGSAAIFSLFLFLVSILYLVGRPNLLYEFVVQLYQGNSFFQNFILGSSGVISSLNSSLSTVALSFRITVATLVEPLSKAIVNLDVLWKYLICQNVAVGASALLILLYCHYSGRR